MVQCKLHSNHAATDPYGRPTTAMHILFAQSRSSWPTSFVSSSLLLGVLFSDPLIYIELERSLFVFNLVPDGNNLHFAKTPCVGFPEHSDRKLQAATSYNLFIDLSHR